MAFADYSDPVGRPSPPPDENAPATSLGLGVGGGAKSAYDGPDVGYGEDIGKGAVGGFGRGVAGLVGTGSMGNLVHAGLSKAGVPEDYIATGAKVVSKIPYLKAFTGPDAAQVQQAIENYTGKFYEPKTVPGQYASTIAEFAPAALMPGGGAAARVVNTVVPALASETAGQLTKGTAAEPYARGVAGLLAGPAAGKIITPAAPARPAYAAAVDTLQREGIPLTAGARTGSNTLKWMEGSAADMPGSAGRAADLNARTANAFDRAITERLYDRRELTARDVPADVNLPDRRVAVAGPASLSDTYNRINANDFVSNAQLHNRMTAAQNEYERLVQPHNRNANVENTRNDIVNRLVAGQGRMAGDEYQAIRSQIGDAERASTNSRETTALRELKAALDQAMAAGLPPADAAALALTNRRFANMKQLDPAVAAAGENLSPQRVAQTVRSGRAANYAAQRGDLDELAKAAGMVIKPMPNSGTAARLGWQNLFGVVGSALTGGVVGGIPGALGGLAVGAVPMAVSRAVVSRPGQAYLGNQVLPQNARDIVTQAMMQQGISQPSGIARNEAERADYERKRKDDLRKLGLE